MKLALSLAVVIVVVISSCAPTAPPSTADVPEHVPQTSPPIPQAVFPDGETFDLELAMTDQEVSTGLSYRPSLPEGRGMLFLFDEARRPSFWMKNMLFSLDLIYLDETGSVVHIEANVPPCAADPCPTYPSSEPAIAVLEVNAGVAATHGIEKGTVLQFERVPGYPVALSQEPNLN
jgi:uncharacterized membrane protein (UPF0127 family)